MRSAFSVINDLLDRSGLSLPPEALASGLDPTHVALRLLHSAFDGLYVCEQLRDCDTFFTSSLGSVFSL